MDVKINITDRQIAALLCSAFEGGSNYWIAHVDIRDKKQDGKPWDDEYTPGYIRAPFSTGGKVIVDPGEGETPVVLDREALSRGIETMAKKHPRHFADLLRENTDADTGDVFLQCCLFDDVIFG